MGRGFDSDIVPGNDIVPVMAHASDPLPLGDCRALWIGTAGNLNITTIAGQERNNVPAQVGLFPVQCSHVRTGATSAASNIWAIY